jgi:hypothetical protein
LKAWPSWMLKESLQLCNRAPNSTTRFCRWWGTTSCNPTSITYLQPSRWWSLFGAHCKAIDYCFCSQFLVFLKMRYWCCSTMVYSFATCPKSITRFKTHARVLRVILLIYSTTFHISINSEAHLGLTLKL